MYRMLAGPPDIPDNISKILAGAIEKAMNDPELLEWSKKGERPLNYMNAKETARIAEALFKTYRKYLDTIKKEVKKIS